jgi:hypothetical protein
LPEAEDQSSKDFYLSFLAKSHYQLKNHPLAAPNLSIRQFPADHPECIEE